MFLLYLLIPICTFLLSYLIVPDLDDPAGIDLRASYQHNRIWLYGILTVVVLVSLADETIENGAVPTDLDALFRFSFFAVTVAGLGFRGDRAQLAVSGILLGGFIAYILRLFLRLA